MRPPQIEQVLRKGLYSLNSHTQLRAYLQEQIDQRSYDFEANLALLKLYQFHPSDLDLDVIHKVLIKALMNLPRMDFTLCLYSLPAVAHQSEGVEALKKASTLLEKAQFPEFWAMFEEDSWVGGVLRGFPGFREAIQAFSVSVLLVTYQAVPLDVLASAVHVNGAELDEFIKKHDGWKREGSLVSLPLSEFNQARQVKATEQLDRKKVANILAVLTK